MAAGFECVEHCSFAIENGTDQDDQLIADIAAKGVAVSLTVGVAPGGPPLPPALRKRVEAVSAAFKAMHAAGVTLVCGSDNGIVAVKPHGSFGYSVADMVTLAGLTPMEALRSATSLAARVCGVADRKGTIAVGRDADLVAVAGDPLADITAVCEVTAVIHAGRVTHRPQPAPARGRSR